MASTVGTQRWCFAMNESMPLPVGEPAPRAQQPARALFQGIVESFKLEGNPKGHVIPLPAANRDTYSSIRCSEPLQPDRGCLQGQGSTTSLRNLFQHLTTMTVKTFFLISNLNLPSFSLKPLPLVLSQQTLLKSLSPCFLQPPFRY